MWFAEDDPRVQAALKVRCGLCGAVPGRHCHSITGHPLNRPVHTYRLEVK